MKCNTLRLFFSVSPSVILLIAIGIILTTVSSGSVDPSDGELFELSIIHINDFHARFEQTSINSEICLEGTEDTCVGGIARIYTAVKHLVDTRPNAVFLNAGDNFQGTLWYNKFKWNVTAYFMNKLPHDALTLGNHEFDDGVAGVVPFLENVNAPFVIANIDDTEEPTIQGKYNKSIIIERSGRKIGIVGYVIKTYPELSSPGKLKFLDEIEHVTREAAKLKTRGADIIIGLSHSGLDVDHEVAAAVPDLDIIVGGHSHSFLFTGKPPSTDLPVDNYPVIVEQSGGRKVLIVQAYAFSKYVGNITVWFDHKGEYVRWEGRPILLDNTVTPDPQILEELKPWQDEIKAEAEAIIGSTKVFLDNSNRSCQKGECNIGRMIADAFVEEYVNTAPEGAWTRAAIGIINSGGIRTSIEETRPGGSITYGDLKAANPFSNTIDIIELQGKHLLEVLELSVSRSFAQYRGNGRHKRDIENKEFNGQGFLQFSGIKVKFDLRKPVHNRVVDVAIRCAECRIPEYEPVDPEKWYGVSIISFLVTGGDGYSVITDNHRNRIIGRVDSDVLMDYIRKMSPITTGIDGFVEMIDSEES